MPIGYHDLPVAAAAAVTSATVTIA